MFQSEDSSSCKSNCRLTGSSGIQGRAQINDQTPNYAGYLLDTSSVSGEDQWGPEMGGVELGMRDHSTQVYPVADSAYAWPSVFICLL